MDEHVKRLRLLLKFAMRVLSELLSDLWAYDSSPYPLLVIVDILRRILRRAGCLDVAGIRRLSVCYQEYFNCRRPHQGINGKTPTRVIHLESRQTQIPAIRYSKTPEVDGLFTSFKLAA